MTVEEEREALIGKLDFALDQLYRVQTSMNNRVAQLERERSKQQALLNRSKEEGEQ